MYTALPHGWCFSAFSYVRCIFSAVILRAVSGAKRLLNRRTYGSVMQDRVGGTESIAVEVAAGYICADKEFIRPHCVTINLKRKWAS